MTLSQSWVQINAFTVVNDRELRYGSSTLLEVLKADSEAIVETGIANISLAICNVLFLLKR